MHKQHEPSPFYPEDELTAPHPRGHADIEEEQVDEEQVDELDQPATFSLLEAVLTDNEGRASEVPPSRLAVQAIVYHHGEILDVLRVDAGESLYSRDQPFVNALKDGRAQVYFTDFNHGWLARDGRLVSLAELRRKGADLVNDDHYRITIGGDDVVQLITPSASYVVRLIPAPRLPKTTTHLSFRRLSRPWKVLAASVLTHCLLIASLGFVRSDKTPDDPFGGLDQPLPPVPTASIPSPKPRVAEPQPTHTPKPATTSEQPPARKQRRASRRVHKPHRSATSAASQQPRSGAASKMLAILSTNARHAANARVKLGRLRVAAGNRSKMALGGVLHKGAGTRVAMGRINDGANPDGRRLGSQAQRSGRLAAKGPSTATRGKLAKPIVRRVRGPHVSRKTILKQIQRYTQQVQRCYEIGLRSNRSLQGTLRFDWVIERSGRVSDARLAGGSLSSTRVAQCITKAIRRWRFSRLPVKVPVRYGWRFAPTTF